MTYDHGGFILWGDQFEDKIDSAIEWLAKYPKFKIGLDNESFAYDEYARRNPSIIKKINKALAEYKGRFGIGSCTYGQPLSVFINEESNARQIIYAIRANLEHFGRTPEIYAISEHALHNQIPQLIKQAGYKGAIMRTHFMMYGYNPTYDAPFGLWIGEDGSAAPTVPTYDNEGAAFGITTFDNWVLTRWPDSTAQSPEQFGEMFRHIEPLLASRYDDIVLRQEGLPKYVEGIDEYQWVLLEDLLSLYGEPREEFKPSSNDFRVRMPWGYCGNEIFNACAAAESAVMLAERANAAAFLMGAPSAQKTLEEAWKNLLVAQHHDIQICGILSDARKYLPASQNLSKAVASESMRYIANQFATEGEHNLVVFNTHSFDIAERVEIEVAQRGAAGYRVTLDGEEVPCDAIVLDSNRCGPTRAVVSFAARTPANTIQVYKVDTSGSAAELTKVSGGYAHNEASGRYAYNEVNGILSAPIYEITLDGHGIKRLYDRELGAYIIDCAKGSLFKGVIDGSDAESAGAWSVSIGGGGAKATYIGMVGRIPLIFEMRLYGNLRRIDCRVRFMHNGERAGSVDIPGKDNGFTHEDKLRFMMNTRLGEDSINARDLPYVIAETDEPNYIQGNYWVARKNKDFGVAIFNGGCRGAVCDGAEFSLPLVYANTYIWGTRILYGESAHEFAIYPFDPKTTESDYVSLHKAALSYSFPPLTIKTGRRDGKFTRSQKVAQINGGEGVIMTAMYPEDGAVLLRVCEYGGAEEEYGGPASQFGKTGECVTIMNKLMERDYGKGAQTSNTGTIGPWEIITHRIYRK